MFFAILTLLPLNFCLAYRSNLKRTLGGMNASTARIVGSMIGIASRLLDERVQQLHAHGFERQCSPSPRQCTSPVQGSQDPPLTTMSTRKVGDTKTSLRSLLCPLGHGSFLGHCASLNRVISLIHPISTMETRIP